jgi:phosphatidyl-myo-inositol alpha-mannosyltransferase
VRIALACPYDWDAPGGVQVHIRQLARILMERGHDVTVLTPGGRHATEPWVRVVGSPVRIGYQGTVAPICFSPSSWTAVGRELSRFGPDVVHAHEPTVPSTSLFATLRTKAPVVATFHAHVERSFLLTVVTPFLRPVWRRLRVRIAVSESAKAFYERRFGDGTRVVPNGCDVKLFGSAEPSPDLPPGRRMLWTHRLDPQKGFPVAVAAFGRLAAEFPDLHLVVIGDGKDRSAVETLPADARTRVVMLGQIQHERLPAYHAGADVFVAPALGQESFGIALVEAMAAGVPVVASDIAGYRDVVSSEVDGLLVPPGDSGRLADAVARVLADSALAQRLTAAGRDRANHFAWHRVVGLIEAAYTEAMADRSA